MYRIQGIVLLALGARLKYIQEINYNHLTIFSHQIIYYCCDFIIILLTVIYFRIILLIFAAINAYMA